MRFESVYFWTVEDSDSELGEELRERAEECEGIELDETLYGFAEGADDDKFENTLERYLGRVEKIGRVAGGSSDDAVYAQRLLMTDDRGPTWVRWFE